MTPAARVAAAIELLSVINSDGRPADAVASHYFRTRRYIGAKDRRAVSERVWGILRRRARLGWWLAQETIEDWPRERVIADLVLTEKLDQAGISAIFNGEHNSPEKLTAEDKRLIQALKGKDIFHHDMPVPVRGEFPDWLEPRFAELFGDNLPKEVALLREEAPVDLRINSLKTDRAAAQAALAKEGLKAEPTKLSPIGLRLPARVALTAQDLFKDGLVEVQDEGSQLVALLADARPGQSVLDLCAGAGGKTLAMAATMQNKGRLVACDTHSGRSERATQRLRRAGVHNVSRRVIEAEGDKWLKRQEAVFDRVLVDAPCSGSGTWRRNPDAKWRLSEENLANLTALQTRILTQAASLVKPGGRLIYATCSLLPEENDRQIDAFLAAHSDFALLPIGEVWAATIGGACPAEGATLKLTPAVNGTDGFYAAVLVRQTPK
jgi:16S rRNA (cytosine967-C5)-methyltransferase